MPNLGVFRIPTFSLGLLSPAGVPQPPLQTAQFAELLGVAPATVLRWRRESKLIGQRQGRKWTFSFQDNREFILNLIRMRSGRAFRPTEFIPIEIAKYSGWHHRIDEFCWLIKVAYATKDDLKRRTFRLDRLLANFLRENRVSLSRIAAVFGNTPKRLRKRVEADLKRGWYNELAYVHPLRPSSLGLGWRDMEHNLSSSAERFAFPSWRIVTAYYATYFYLRGPTQAKFSNFRLEEHSATIECFKNNLSSPLSRVLWRFPFDLAVRPGVTVQRASVPKSAQARLHFQYARHPRSPYRTPEQIRRKLIETFRRQAAKRGGAGFYTIFDYLRDLRVWANYVDIENSLKLRGPGYRGFMDQNLSTLLFFVAAVGELCFAAVFGEMAYARAIQQFCDAIQTSNPEIGNRFRSLPMYQRLGIYRHVGILSAEIRLVGSQDPHAIDLS